eukprot:TRINITY_DN3857_c0_g2_i1.p2 TRINITY_DN3857_c0_g2~~TRINITY_DN3857_c0_g2_i1.p2  ORF type:complete len:105 (-),score=17.92 TRINITY_DN3857_c0_g2_i1:300-614(-)
MRSTRALSFTIFFFFNDTATTEIYTRSIVGSVRCVQETEADLRRFHFARSQTVLCASDIWIGRIHNMLSANVSNPSSLLSGLANLCQGGVNDFSDNILLRDKVL